MKLNAKLEKAFLEQMTDEIYTAHQYLAMSFQLEDEGFKGAAHWLFKQYEEEMEHAHKIIKYLQERGNRVKMPAIDAPPASYGKPLEVFEAVLASEIRVTKKIHSLYALADKEKDISAKIFLNWFVTEQDEEEDSASEVVELLKKAGTNMGALMVIDRELAAR